MSEHHSQLRRRKRVTRKLSEKMSAQRSRARLFSPSTDIAHYFCLWPSSLVHAERTIPPLPRGQMTKTRLRGEFCVVFVDERAKTLLTRDFASLHN